MATSVQNRKEIPFNNQVLKWARERHRRSYEEAAKGAGVTAAKIIEWEAGTATPTVRQARLLAEVYKRPFLEFFSKNIPEIVESELVPDFRLHRDVPSPEESNELLEIQSWAETQRLNAIDLFEILGEQPPRFPEELYATIASPPSDAAKLSRDVSDFPISEQIGLKSSERDNLPKILRRKLEGLGIIVLKNNALANFGARGLCVFASPLPVIVFGGEAPSAQAFTLAHELGHVMLKQSAIIGPPPPRFQHSSVAKIEEWCNEFAAAFLVPDSALAAIFPRPSRPEESIADDALTMLASRFSVSRHAMLIRLVKLRYIKAEYYWQIKRAQFISEESAYEAFGRPSYYGSRYRSAVGDLYTGLVLEAWSSGRITNHNAGEFMGIKNLVHLESIRDHFGS